MSVEFDDLFDDLLCGEECGSFIMGVVGQGSGLVVWEEPSDSEITSGKFDSNNYSLFLTELRKANLSPRMFRQAVLYPHPGSKPACKTASFGRLMGEINLSTVVLAMGAEVSKILSGNDKIQTAICVPCFWNKSVKLITAPSPGLAYVRSVGELRLAITKFAKELGNAEN